MRCEVHVDGEEELRSLVAWLRAEPGVRRNATISLEAGPAEPDTMGDALGWVQLVAGTGLQAADFVLALTAWRRTRPHAPRVTVRRGDIEVTVDGGDPDTVAAVVRVLEQR